MTMFNLELIKVNLTRKMSGLGQNFEPEFSWTRMFLLWDWS